MMIVVLLAFVLIFVYWMLIPSQKPSQYQPEDYRRDDIDEHYQLILQDLRELQQSGQPDSRQLAILKVQAAQLLAEREALPPPPAAQSLQRNIWLPASLSVLAVVVLLILAVPTLAQWQHVGLEDAEKTSLIQAARLPELAKGSDKLLYANTLFDAGRYDGAIPIYAEVLQQSPREASALRRLGVLLMRNKDLNSQAIGLIERSTQIAPKDSEGWLFLGYAYNNVGANGPALQALLRFKQVAPDRADADDLISSLSGQQLKLSGAQLYAQNCQSCHGDQAKGLQGREILGSANAFAQSIRNGANGMPAFSQFSDAQLELLRKYIQKP